jgi:hypothetical protein
MTTSKESEFIKEHLARVATTLRRAEHLIAFAENYSPIKPPAQVEDDIKDDILRAAVVLLHATLEDFLRFIACRFVPFSNEDILNTIGLAGGSHTGRPEKFFLGKLGQHRGKTVDQLISESVEAHFDNRSFNNTNDISQVLQSAGVPLDVVEKFYPSLSQLMTRRHEIVHRGDLIASGNKQSEREAAPIEANRVEEWYKTVFSFLTEVATHHLKASFN